MVWHIQKQEDGNAERVRECKKDSKVPLRRVGILKIGEREVICGVHGNSTQ